MSKFIVIEGIDGCGSTTQTFLLANKIFENFKQHRVLLTREPTYGNHGAKIRQLLREGTDVKENGELFLELFVKDRKEHLAMFEGLDAVVISDRHKHSTYAYQQAQGMNYDDIHQAHEGMRAPELTVIIDLPVDVAMQRMDSKHKEVFDKDPGFLEKVRQNYLALANQLDENIVVVNGDDSKENVAEAVWKQVEKIL
jgi:dTMP kinase